MCVLCVCVCVCVREREIERREREREREREPAFEPVPYLAEGNHYVSEMIFPLFVSKLLC